MRQFEYTYANIAEASGRSVGSIRVDISRGSLDPADLSSVSLYVIRGMLGDMDERNKKR